MFFWDYGNAFLLEAKRAGAKVEKPGGDESGIEFRYALYNFFRKAQSSYSGVSITWRSKVKSAIVVLRINSKVS